MDVSLTWSNGESTTASVSPTPPITGETTGSILSAVTGPLSAAISGLPLRQHEKILGRLHRAIKGNTTAKCAVDLAVHAALGAACGGLPELMGVARGPVGTDITVSVDSPEAMASAACQRAEEGFEVLKLKLGGGGGSSGRGISGGGSSGGGSSGDGAEADVARVRAVAEAIRPGVRVRLDANQAWTAGEALGVLRALERLGIRPELIEQPVPADDLAGLAAVRRHGTVPVLADESVHSARDALRVAEAGAADLVNVKLAKCGGLRAARDVVATAQACGLGVLVGCMLEPASTVAVAAYLALSLPGGYAHDLDAAWWAGDEGHLNYRPPVVEPV